jgi:cytochrome b pre-mRNA-processing protein 3
MTYPASVPIATYPGLDPRPRPITMIFQLFRRNDRAGTIRALYGAIVAQARRPAFYRDYGVPDSVEGRFDMIALHVILFFRRVRAEREQVRALGQEVFDAFCRDMDHNLREMGVSDVGIPRKMRGLGEAYYGRAMTYDHALSADGDEALVAALARNVFAMEAAPAGASRLASYVREAVRRLDREDGDAFAASVLDFPDPDTISPAEGGAIVAAQKVEQ